MNERKFLTLKEVQKEQTMILKKVAEFCDKENIKYYLAGGSMLGAIRHKGFIPWDDDIDIVMPRPDYEKFYKIVEENNYYIDDDLELRSFRFNNLFFPFGKVVNKKLKMETHYYDNEFDSYLWIDIFPLDGLPENNLKNKLIYKRVRFWRKILLMVEVKNDVIEKESKHKFLILPKKFLKKIFGTEKSLKKIINKMDKISKTYNWDNCKYIGGLVWGYGPNERLLKSDLGDYLVDFEDIKVNTMACYDTYLSNLYGNYMELPPEEKRIAHDIKVYKEEE